MAARFVMSASTVAGLADLGLPEYAFVGRSNVGKSSLIGALFGRPKMVRTSRTPGRTQTLNLFVLDERLAIVDLPGYGYAKLSHAVRRQLDEMMRDYVRRRGCLRGVIQILDARREQVSDADRLMSALVLQNNLPLLLVVSKVDLLPKTRRGHQVAVIEQELGVPRGTALACSSKTLQGLQQLRQRLDELIL